MIAMYTNCFCFCEKLRIRTTAERRCSSAAEWHAIVFSDSTLAEAHRRGQRFQRVEGLTTFFALDRIVQYRGSHGSICYYLLRGELVYN